MLNNYICAVDIGSSKISAVCAVLKNKKIVSLFMASTPSRGVKKGIVVDSVELTNCLSGILKSLKSKSGVNIRAIFCAVSGSDITTKHSRAIIPLAERGNKVVTLTDIHKVNEQARILASSLDEESIHQIPFSYSLDSKEEILNPLGLYGHRMETDLYLVCAKTSTVDSLTRAVNQAGYEIKKIYFSGIATASAVFGRQQEGFSLLCDIGSDITEILLFQDGLLRNIEVMPLGAEEISLAIARELGIPLDLAENVKKSHSFVSDPGSVEEDKEILIKKDNIYRPVKQKLLLEIVNPQVESLCRLIKERVGKNISIDHIKNFVVGGRAVLLDGFLEKFEHVLGIPVQLGRVIDPEIANLIKKDEVSTTHAELAYLTALGVVIQESRIDKLYLAPVVNPPSNFFLKTLAKAKEVYQEYF